jgi:hypothetical protein
MPTLMYTHVPIVEDTYLVGMLFSEFIASAEIKYLT